MLLTIAIPTYNRAEYLARCLESVLTQINTINQNLVEILVINNNSIDNTLDQVHYYKSNFINENFKIVTNNENIGLDGNITKAYSLASGDFVLILGDDDILVNNTLEPILELLSNNNECGIIYLNSFGLKDNYINHNITNNKLKYQKINNSKYFFRIVNYYFTYISGNIINKKLINDKILLDRFLGTNLNLLNWNLTAALFAKYNIFISDFIIATKTENTGGYAFAKTFASNSNFIFNYFIEQGYDKKHFRIINNSMLINFFPFFIQKSKENKINNSLFIKENYFNILYNIYKYNFRFWLFTFPAIILPPKTASKFLYCNRVYQKIINKIYSING